MTTAEWDATGGVCPKDASERMIRYFRSCSEGNELPTFSGAAATLGVEAPTLDEWRRIDPVFARAWRACLSILTDHLIVMGLTKRYDASLVKYLLALYGMGDEGENEPDELSVKIEVLEGGSGSNGV